MTDTVAICITEPTLHTHTSDRFNNVTFGRGTLVAVLPIINLWLYRDSCNVRRMGVSLTASIQILATTVTLLHIIQELVLLAI